MEERAKAILAALSGALSALAEDYGMILLLGCAFILLDLVTGLAKAKISGTVSSAVGSKGFWRKAALLAALAFGICVDKLMGEMIPGFASPIGRLLGLYIAVNEAISICENLDACGIRLPKILSSALESAGCKLDAGK